MLLVLLTLAGYLFFVELPNQREAEREEQDAKKVFQLDQTDITTVSLQYPDFTIGLRKTEEGKWIIVTPMALDTEQREVENLIATIADMRLKRLVSERDENPKEYGFDPPSVEIDLGVGNKKEQVIIGDKGPIPDTLFVKQGSTQKVFLTAEWIIGSLTRTVFDLRKKSIWSINREGVNELWLDFPSGRYQFIKKDSRWEIHEPAPVRADQDTVMDLIGTLANLRATGFIDLEDQKTETRKQFPDQFLTATIHAGSISSVASFYRGKGDSTVYADISSEQPLYQISASVLSEFKPNLFHYQDKHLMNFDSGQIYKIEVKTDQDAYVLRRSNDQWKIEGDTAELDQDEIVQFLHRLGQTETQDQSESMTTQEIAGLDNPQAEVRLLDSNDEYVAGMAIGAEHSGQFYAQGDPELGIVLLNKNTLDGIPRKDEMIVHDAPENNDGE